MKMQQICYNIFSKGILDMNTNKLYELSEKADKILNGESSDNIKDIIKELKPIISPFKQGSIGIAQLNPIVGDIEYNSKKL